MSGGSAGLPTSGGPYYWAAFLAGRHGAFVSWVTGSARAGNACMALAASHTNAGAGWFSLLGQISDTVRRQLLLSGRPCAPARLAHGLCCRPQSPACSPGSSPPSSSSSGTFCCRPPSCWASTEARRPGNAPAASPLAAADAAAPQPACWRPGAPTRSRALAWPRSTRCPSCTMVRAAEGCVPRGPSCALPRCCHRLTLSPAPCTRDPDVPRGSLCCRAACPDGPALAPRGRPGAPALRLCVLHPVRSIHVTLRHQQRWARPHPAARPACWPSLSGPGSALRLCGLCRLLFLQGSLYAQYCLTGERGAPCHHGLHPPRAADKLRQPGSSCQS